MYMYTCTCICVVRRKVTEEVICSMGDWKAIERKEGMEGGKEGGMERKA